MVEEKIYSGMGYCKLCRQELLDVNGIKTCVECKGKENQPSGLVNAIKDPGHTVLTTMLKKQGVEVEIGDVKKVELKKESNIGIAFTLEELTNLNNDSIKSLAFKRICESLDEMPFSTMKDAKMVMKIQEKLESTNA